METNAIQTERGTWAFDLHQPTFGHGGNARIDEEVRTMVSKAVAGVDGWFIQPEAVLQDQRDQGTEPRPGRLFMSVDPDASDVELEHAAIAALDRIFGPVGVVPRSVLDPVGASSGGLIDPYGGPNEDDPDLFGPDPEVGPDEINGPWED